MVVIGIGNPFRHDDGIGLLVAQRLRRQAPAWVEVVEQLREAFVLFELWEKAELVIVVDAVVSGAKPGTIYRLDVQQESLPTAWFHGSTHGFGLAETLELARALRQLPPQVLIYGIEARSWEPGVGLSPDLERVIPTVVERILWEVRCTSCR